MVNVILHGLGQTPSSWEMVKERTADVVLQIPDLFKLVGSPIDYDVLSCAEDIRTLIRIKCNAAKRDK